MKPFEEAKAEIIRLEAVDIICTSCTSVIIPGEDDTEAN